MHITETTLYKKAFQAYLRRGIPVEYFLKAEANAHETRYYIWRTRGDDKVRPSHAANNGRIFSWDAPPPTGHPGEAYGCRCWAEPYKEPPYSGAEDLPIEPVYPESLVLIALRGHHIFHAWQNWLRIHKLSREWRLGNHKSVIKWTNRLKKGNWTPEKITRVIKKGKNYKAPNNINKANTATRYELNGEFVVIDDVTKEIIQVSGSGYIPVELP